MLDAPKASLSLRSDDALKLCEYGRIEYWDARYMTLPNSYDWYMNYKQPGQKTTALRNLILKFCAKDGLTLILGSGNSSLPGDMYLDGYSNIRNVDFSRVVIDQMKRKYCKMKSLEWTQADVCDMPFEDCSFDCAIDKGTIDALFCSDDASLECRIKSYCQEVDRVLKSGGVWIVLSYGPPEARLEFLENDGYSQHQDMLSFVCEVISIPKSQVLLDGHSGMTSIYPYEETNYYAYICTKDPGKALEKEAMQNEAFKKKEGNAALVIKQQRQKERLDRDGHLAKKASCVE
eukprot:CAMPEP_0194382342 /NCGR_PEP_ID=MMETSP0174-20130528/59798_1 /TAXON_ID=216777 /ORGANISM="Proboscia alata, Strain PI-D3" /LENGTH=289 /DNA_ID=CAMNT_0039167567 /DNA_START=163 /DNA_END=1032 /DNA_ORIENTATION=-